VLFIGFLLVFFFNEKTHHSFTTINPLIHFKEHGQGNWGHSSSGRALTYQMQHSRFNPQYSKKGGREAGRKTNSQMWWPMPIIPALRRLRQEDHKFKANLGYI
jgi:hypothetical protein